ncbi:hypothetical protein I4U23_016777 [Adineta vaga]|nr:hypothetical protein I4U23_016777 [Adineta vaga]
MSRSAFNQYNRDIIIPNTYRIETLRIENYFMFDYRVLALFNKRFLRTLILENIEEKYLKNVLDQLTPLPNLSSLSIATVDKCPHQTSIYGQIFRLPFLKYCKISAGDRCDGYLPPCAMNNYSPIEHLIIDSRIQWSCLHIFLSYVPHLRRLQISLDRIHPFRVENLPYYTMNNLLHLSLEMGSFETYMELQKLFKNYFPFLEVLHISLTEQTLNANEWERIISLYLPNLRIFDVLFKVFLRDDREKAAFDKQVDLLRSSFWINRQWFFDYNLSEKLRNNEYRILYSTNPYRRRDYEIFNGLSDMILPNEYTIFKSVDHLLIKSEMAMENCDNYFPNVNKITIEDEFSATSCQTIPISFRRMLPLEQLQTLIIKCRDLSFFKMIELLSYAPNLRTLTSQSILFHNENATSVKESKIFQSVSETNCIRNFICHGKCTLDIVELLVMLFPHLQHLAIYTELKDLEVILEFLLSKDNGNTFDLFLFSLMYADERYLHLMNSQIKLKFLPYRCKFINLFRRELFLCF